MVKLELHGRVVSLAREQAERVRAFALAHAGSSSRRRDLALVLDWALNDPRVVVLRRSEARELQRLAQEETSLTDVAAVLAGSPARPETRAA
jgi:hypothetical protein